MDCDLEVEAKEILPPAALHHCGLSQQQEEN